MTRLWVMFLACLLTASWAWAQPAGSSEQQQQKRGARSIKGTESRQQNTKSQTVRDTHTVSNEIGVGALFFPLLKILEDRNLFFLNFTGGESLRCTVFSPQYVYSDVEGAIQTLTSDPRGGRSSATFEEAAFTVVQARPRQLIVLTAAKEIFGEPAFPAYRLECLFIYAQIVDEVVRTLLAQYGDQVRKNPYGESVYVIPNLQALAWRLIDKERTNKDILNYTGSCMVPTSNGLQQGANDVRCGLWSFKSQGGDPTLEKSGVKWLAQDYIMGRRVLFAEGRSIETGTTRQTTESVSKTREQSQERSTSQGATVVKPSR